MKSTKVQPSAKFGGNVAIFGLKTPLYVYVLGEHTSMEMSCSRTILIVMGLSIEPHSSTMYIDLSIHVQVHVVKD